MARTTSTAVEGILLNDYDGESSLTPFIDTASSIVDDVVACASRKGITLDATKLELIERWLSAHAYAMSDQPYLEKETAAGATGRARGKFQGQTKMMLEASKYGQTALTLDPSGCLNSLNSKPRRASVVWLGKPPSEQIDYEDRD